MRIDKVEAIAVEIPLTKVFAGSKYSIPSRNTIVTRIHTGDGLVSEVYNGDNRAHGRELVKIIHEELAPLVMGEDPFAYERLWRKMLPVSLPIRDRKVAMEAIACIDTALWDLMGKAAGVSVHRMLGGFRDRIQIITIGGYYLPGKTEADLAKEMEWLRGVGMAGCKVKVGGMSAEQDAARVRAARQGGGKDFVIAVDANRAWDVAEAVKFARLVEPLNIRWFEEPCHWYDDARSMAQVRHRTSIPINAGQSEISGQGVRRLLEAGAVDIVNFDASESGGITEWRRAAGMCALHDVEMAHHEEPQIAVHMLAAVPHGTFVECFADPERDPLWDKMLVNRPPIKDGWIEVPKGPGFDIKLDWDMVKKYRIA